MGMRSVFCEETRAFAPGVCGCVEPGFGGSDFVEDDETVTEREIVAGRHGGRVYSGWVEGTQDVACRSFAAWPFRSSIFALIHLCNGFTNCTSSSTETRVLSRIPFS